VIRRILLSVKKLDDMFSPLDYDKGDLNNMRQTIRKIKLRCVTIVWRKSFVATRRCHFIANIYTWCSLLLSIRVTDRETDITRKVVDSRKVCNVTLGWRITEHRKFEE